MALQPSLSRTRKLRRLNDKGGEDVLQAPSTHLTEIIVAIPSERWYTGPQSLPPCVLLAPPSGKFLQHRARPLLAGFADVSLDFPPEGGKNPPFRLPLGWLERRNDR